MKGDAHERRDLTRVAASASGHAWTRLDEGRRSRASRLGGSDGRRHRASMKGDAHERRDLAHVHRCTCRAR